MPQGTDDPNLVAITIWNPGFFKRILSLHTYAILDVLSPDGGLRSPSAPVLS